MCPHVTHLINRFNELSLWVATVILMFPKTVERTAAILKFIKIAEHLDQLSNYHTLSAVIAGLNLAPISRIKHSWLGVDKASKEV
jgi:hypothetical protein